MDPLTAIRQWFDSGVQTMREELVFLVYKFHTEPGIAKAPSQKSVKEFEAYMDSRQLSRAVIVQRALFMRGLINFGLCGRDTEAGWEQARQKNEHVDRQLAVAGMDNGKMYKEFMKEYSLRKAQWIAWSNVWRSLERDVLSDDCIGYWYYVEGVISTGRKSV